MEKINVFKVEKVDSCTYVTTNDFDGEVFRIVSGNMTFTTRGKSGSVFIFKAMPLDGEDRGFFLGCDRFTAYMKKWHDALMENDKNFHFPEEGEEVELPSEEEARRILSEIPDQHEHSYM